jgi:hypothetical protein
MLHVYHTYVTLVNL